MGNQTSTLRTLEVPRLSENEIVKHIARHYPGYLRAILVSLPECTILTAMKILGEEGQSDQPTENKTNSPKTSQNDSYNNDNNSSSRTNNNWNNHRNSEWNNMPHCNSRWNNNCNNDKSGEVQPNSQQQTEKINQVVTKNDEPAGTSNTEQQSTR